MSIDNIKPVLWPDSLRIESAVRNGEWWCVVFDASVEKSWQMAVQTVFGWGQHPHMEFSESDADLLEAHILLTVERWRKQEESSQ